MILKLASNTWVIGMVLIKNSEEYNPNKKHKILIAFDSMIVGILNNKKRNPILTELFIRGRELS